MPKYIAKNTIGYTSKDSIAPGETFDPAEKGISPADVKALFNAGQIQAAPEEFGTSTKSASGKPNVAATLELIAAALTIEDLDKLAEGEERKSVLPAIEARRSELASPQ